MVVSDLTEGNIIDRLRCAYSKGDEPPCEECTFCAARAEIDRLRAEVEQLESAWTFVNIWKGRYYPERALADQLAEALRDAHGTATRHAVCWCSTDSEYPTDCDSTAALAAYEAARNPMTLDKAVNTLGTVHK